MSLQTRLAALVTAIGTDIKANQVAAELAQHRALLVPGGSSSTPDPTFAIMWERASSGGLVAYKQVRETGTAPNRTAIETNILDAEAGTGFASWSQQARVSIGGSRVAALLSMAATSALRQITVQAENPTGPSYSKKLLDSAGRSDFLQKGARLDVTNQSANLTLVSGIDGETDQLWEIVMLGKLHPNGSAGRYVSICPNNWTGAISPYHRNWRNNDGTAGHDAGVATDNGCVAGRSDFTNDEGNFLSRTIIGTKAGGKRMYSSEWQFTSGSTFATLRGICGGSYYGPVGQDNTAISSFVLNLNSQLFTGAITVKTLI